MISRSKMAARGRKRRLGILKNARSSKNKDPQSTLTDKHVGEHKDEGSGTEDLRENEEEVMSGEKSTPSNEAGEAAIVGEAAPRTSTSTAVIETNMPNSDVNSLPIADGTSEEWTIAREIELIELYKNCPHLYDKTSPGYQQRNKKELAFAKFGEIMGVTGETAAARFKTLRTAYTRLTQKQPSGSGRRTLTERNRHILKNMAFLEVHIRSRPTLSTFRSAGLHELEDEDGDDEVEQELLPQSENRPDAPNATINKPSMVPPTTPTSTLPTQRSGQHIPSTSTRPQAAIPSTSNENVNVTEPPAKVRKISSMEPGQGQAKVSRRNRFLSTEAATEIEKGRTGVLEKMTNLMGMAVKSVENKPQEKSENLKWAELLALKVDKLPVVTQDDLKFAIDSLVFQAGKGQRGVPNPPQVLQQQPQQQEQGVLYQRHVLQPQPQPQPQQQQQQHLQFQQPQQQTQLPSFARLSGDELEQLQNIIGQHVQTPERSPRGSPRQTPSPRVAERFNELIGTGDYYKELPGPY